MLSNVGANLLGRDSSVTRMGEFLTFSATTFHPKEVQIVGGILGYFERRYFLSGKLLLQYLLGNFLKRFGYFLTPTSGHCGPR